MRLARTESVLEKTPLSLRDPERLTLFKV